MFEKEITEKLKAMKRSGMTYAEISKATKFPASYIHQVVTGAKQIRNPTVKAVMNVFPNAFIKFGMEDEKSEEPKLAKRQEKFSPLLSCDCSTIESCESSMEIPAEEEDLHMYCEKIEKSQCFPTSMPMMACMSSPPQENEETQEDETKQEETEEDDFELLDKLMSSEELSDDIKVTIFKLFSKCRRR